MKKNKVQSTFINLLFVVAGGLAPAGAGTAQDYDKFRKVLVSPTVNTPDYFEGFGGFCGWPKVVCLQNGDLLVSFQAGYWHASWPTPLDFPPDYLEQMTSANPVLKEWHEKNKAPEGGRNFWIRSKDNGRTWSRPRPFPHVRGAEGIECLIQMSDGTLFAAHNVEAHRGWVRPDLSKGLPADPLSFSKIAADRFPQPFVVHRSDDNGETWRKIARLTGPFILSVAVQGLMEDPRDGRLVALATGTPFPVGEGWPERDGHVMALIKTLDKGENWKVTSVFEQKGPGDEKNVGYLPDGSLGMASRPFSEWIQSYDHGLTWSEPRHLLAGRGDSKGRTMKRGELIQGSDGLAVLVFCGGSGGNGQVIYSRDDARTWIKPAPGRGFRFDPLQYYPNACLLKDGSIFSVGVRQRIENKFGPFGAETLAMRFRIKSPEEGEGVELLPIGEPKTVQVPAPVPSTADLRWRATKPQLVHAGESAHRYAARPSMVRLKDGTLLASLEWNAGEGASTVLFIESLDGGKSWSKPFKAKVPIDHSDGGVMGLMNDGRILMACDQAHGSNLGAVKNRSGKPLPKLIKKTGRRPDGKETEAYENYRYYSDTWITFSSDRGRTWSAGRKVEHESLMGSSLWTGARPAELADGTMVIPIDGYLSSDDMDGIWLSSGVLRSSDKGGTWKFSVVGQTDRKQGLVFSEPAMAELRDGRLVFMMRTQNRVIEEEQISDEFRSGLYRSVSSDGGRTWSTPVRVLTGTHCSITQLGDGQLLCGWHRPIQYALSSDAGKTWTKPEPWFLGRDSHQGWYTNVEFYDDETAVAMLKDYGSHPNWIWACRLALVMDDTKEQTAGRDGFPVGKSRADQGRNALLLSDYEYEWKIAGMAGYSGQDLQRIHTIDHAGQAIRTRVGGRGNYKAGMARLENGRVVLAVCQQHKDYYTNPKNRTFSMVVYESPDSGRTWREIARPSIHAKEPSLTVTADGALLLTAQDFRLNRKRNEMWVCRSTDGGRTWDKTLIPGRSYPRNVLVEQDGTLLFLRSKEAEKFELCRSGDHGKTWTFSEGLIDWRPEDISAFSEVSVLRLKSGNLLAALRHRRPVARSGAAPRGHRGHALARTLVTVSGDDGKTWSTPQPLTNTGEVHGNLLQLKDGRIMASYVNYHQPFGVCVVLSHDEGKTWNTDRRVQLSFSAVTATGNNGWPVSLELGDDRFLTCFANNAYPYDDPPTVTCETVQWKLPPSMQPTQLRSKQ